MMTAEERAAETCEMLDIPTNGHAHTVILHQIRLAMRDQRHACSEALHAVDGVSDEAHTAVFNAHIRKERVKP